MKMTMKTKINEDKGEDKEQKVRFNESLVANGECVL